jgi:hypothetical protein
VTAPARRSSPYVPHPSTPRPTQRPRWARLATYALAYALVYPATQVAGYGLEMIGITLTLPFVAYGGWIAGVSAVGLLDGWLGEGPAYLLGATLAIFAQAYVVLALLAGWRDGRRRPDPRPAPDTGGR